MPALRKATLLSVVIFAAATIGCHSHEEYTPSGAECLEESTLTWDNFGEPFMEKYCTRCHASTLSGSARQGAPNDHNFDSVEGVRAELEHVDGQAAAGPDVVNTGMPLGAPTPTEDERRQLGEWLACGAP